MYLIKNKVISQVFVIIYGTRFIKKHFAITIYTYTQKSVSKRRSYYYELKSKNWIILICFNFRFKLIVFKNNVVRRFRTLTDFFIFFSITISTCQNNNFSENVNLNYIRMYVVKLPIRCAGFYIIDEAVLIIMSWMTCVILCSWFTIY